jgi:glycosyltransferase involved in cell wall biosynthesis
MAAAQHLHRNPPRVRSGAYLRQVTGDKRKNMVKHAAVTIVSKNYLAYAQTLADSYKKHHPENDFLVILVDRADGYVSATLPHGNGEVVELANIAIPDLSRFIYRYSIMELNTAVKAFVLADLFRRRSYETLLYIDPDIYVFRPLTHVYEALQQASIVLIPHMRRPFYDDAVPSDVAILQSGTYNLGFIGLRNGSTSRELLEWWTTKLHTDCVVDIPRGLFVDQKWIDLVPGFFPDHRILYEPGYNAAYWNLHERAITHENGEWRADGRPLHFFHFSGYSPFAPEYLSKHQNRHRLSSAPTLKRLTDFYGRALLENGYDESSSWPYAFETLPNGVPVPLQLVAAVMQWAVRNKVPTPCPVKEPDAFCRFLMSRNVVPNRDNVVLLFHFLLRARGDVVGAFPNAVWDSDDPGFRDWINSSGMREYKFKELLAFENNEVPVNAVAEVFRRLHAPGLEEAEKTSRAIWGDSRSFDDLVAWLASHGARQMRIPRHYASLLKQAVPAVGRILNVYFLRADVQLQYPALWSDDQITQFVHWLNESRYELQLTPEEISLFAEFARASKPLIETMRFLYLHKGGKTKGSPNIYSVDQRRGEIGSMLSSAQARDFLYDSKAADPLDHYLDAFKVDGGPMREEFGSFSVDGLDHRRNFLFLKELEKRLAARRSTPCVANFAGYLTAPSGMGESARSMRRTLAQCEVAVREITLPHVRAEVVGIPSTPYLFGWPASGANVSITVANADSGELLKEFLPRSYWSDKNVGYWVWETEELPLTLKKSEALFDEIWVPSSYTAKAVARTVSRAVRVLPHTLDFIALERAARNRRQFGLPEDATLFGFMFDPESGMQRKNVEGLIRAFGAAFRGDDKSYLILKVNGRTEGLFDYEMVRARTEGERVLFFDRPLSRSQSYDFMASLDVYVSLHRCEGFGLTCAEAMALGLPVLASAYSGNLDFMRDDNAVLVPTRIIQTDRPYGPYPAGTRWGDPDLEAAAALLRSLLHKDQRQLLGERARSSVRQQLSVDAVAPVAGALLAALTGISEIGDPPARRADLQATCAVAPASPTQPAVIAGAAATAVTRVS